MFHVVFSMMILGLSQPSAYSQSIPKGNQLCAPPEYSSDGLQTITTCWVDIKEPNKGMTRITKYSGGKSTTDQLDPAGNVVTAGALNHNVTGNTTGYTWQNNEQYAGSDGECKTGKMIDGKYSCAGGTAALKGAQITDAGAQMIGAGALNQYGQQVYGDIAASGGNVADAYDGQAKLMERAGQTQKGMGAVSLGSGAAQMLAYRKAMKNKGELEQELAMVDKRLSIETSLNSKGDGKTKGEFGYISGDKIDSRGIIKESGPITQRVIENFSLNEVAKVNAIAQPTGTEYAAMIEANVLDANKRYTTNYSTFELRQNAIMATLKDNTKKAAALSGLRKFQMADAELGKKKALVSAQAKQILKQAISEQQAIAGQTAAGAAISSVKGYQQFRAGKEQEETAKSLKKLAGAIRQNGAAAPPIVLGSNGSDTGGTDDRRGGGGLNGGGPDISLTTSDPNPNGSPLPGGFNPLGDPTNTGNMNEDQKGPMAGAFMASDAGAHAGGAGGGNAGGGARGGVNFGALPTDSAVNAANGKTGNADPYNTYAKGSDYKTPTAVNGALNGNGAGMSDAMMAEMMKNFGREDGSGKTVDADGNSRSPASADVQFLSADTDIFKQISLAYRGKLEAGAVGIVGNP